MDTFPARSWPRLLAVTTLLAALIVGTAPVVGADDAPTEVAPVDVTGDAPPGATDGVPVGSWDDPVDAEEGETDPGASPAAVTQRYFGADAFEAIEDSAAATPRACTISTNGLVALVLAPVFRESSAAVTPGSEPAPMTLSRYDEWSGSYPPPDTNQNTNYGLYAFSDPNTPFPRAYWHPGIGVWQYDSAGVGAPFTAAERIDTGIASADVAAGMATRYCNASGSDQAKRYAAWAPWGNPCTVCQQAFFDLTSTSFASLTLTDDVSATGGMIATTCSFSGSPGTFPCHFVDPSRAEGANWWTASPGGGSPTSGMTPLSAPFYVFERNGYEERHWLIKDTGYFSDIVARRQIGKNARPRANPAGSGLVWDAGPGLCDAAYPETCGQVPPGTLQTTQITDRAALPLTGDFDGDGTDDLFWYAPGGATDDRWISDGDTSFTTSTMTVSGDYQPLVGDFDGNGDDDIFWYSPGSATDYYWWSGDKAQSHPTNVNGSYSPFVADFDGNGSDEIFWYAPGSVPDFVWSWNTSRQRSSRSQPVLGSYQPILGDFDGDEATDLFWYKAGPGADHLWYGRAGGFDHSPVGVGGTYQPLVGDFDDDQRDDIIWYRAGSDPDYTWFGASVGFASVRNDIFGIYRAFVVDLDPSTDSGGDDVIFYGPGGGNDVRWQGRPDRTFEASVDINIGGDYVPLTGEVAGTDRGDIVFWDPFGNSDVMWSW